MCVFFFICDIISVYIVFRYMDFFPDGEKKKQHLYVEKSANYFDSLKTPLRAFSVIPNAKLIIISIDPKLRAYSWYQV